MTEFLAPYYPEFDVVERVRSMDAQQRRHLSLVIEQDPILAAAPVEAGRLPIRSFKAAGKGPRDLSRNTDKYLASDAECDDPETASSPAPAAQMLPMPDGSGSRPILRDFSFIASGSGPRDLAANKDKYLAMGAYQD